jgi:hypothetical protein
MIKTERFDDNKRTNNICGPSFFSLARNGAEAGLLNKRSCLAAALGVTEFEAIYAVNVVTLCRAT